MNNDNLPKHSFFRCLFENITGKVLLSSNNVEPDTLGEPESACNPARSLVYEVRTTSGWKVFRRPGK
jgi:hypothetical protein